jgi:hypothetical protein
MYTDPISFTLPLWTYTIAVLRIRLIGSLTSFGRTAHSRQQRNLRMPLHLLGKKSWNVYNASNVERVRRDEAAAKAAEEAAEERMQEADAVRRLAIMRGETPPPLPAEETPETSAVVRKDYFPTGERRKRKRAGEDDTDFEMRLAKERAAEGEKVSMRLAERRDRAALAPALTEDAKVVGKRDMPAGPTTFGAMKEVQAGWYAKPVRPGDEDETAGRDAFGREDPGRKSRDAVRLDKNDPLAMMKRGAAKVSELGQERKREAEERERELRALRKEQKRAEKRRKSEGAGGRHEVGELEGFSLDKPAVKMESDEAERRRESRHRGRREDKERKEWRDERYRPHSRHRPDSRERHHRSHRADEDGHRHRTRHRHHER